MKNFYTYFHIRNDTGKVFYVGKGKGERAYDSQRSKHWKDVVVKHGHSVHVASAWSEESEAFAHEKFLISCFKAAGHPLVNQTDGGEGASGRVCSDETKLKISASSMKHSVSERTRRLISEKLAGCRMHTEESRARISAANRGVKKSEQMRARLSASTKGKRRPHVTDEMLKRIQALAAEAVRGKQQPSVVCPYCGKSGGRAAMARWHGSNCKSV